MSTRREPTTREKRPDSLQATPDAPKTNVDLDAASGDSVSPEGAVVEEESNSPAEESLSIAEQTEKWLKSRNEVLVSPQEWKPSDAVLKAQAELDAIAEQIWTLKEKCEEIAENLRQAPSDGEVIGFWNDEPQTAEKWLADSIDGVWMEIESYKQLVLISDDCRSAELIEETIRHTQKGIRKVKLVRDLVSRIQNNIQHQGDGDPEVEHLRAQLIPLTNDPAWHPRRSKRNKLFASGFGYTVEELRDARGCPT
jgi:hypothetical protein